MRSDEQRAQDDAAMRADYERIKAEVRELLGQLGAGEGYPVVDRIAARLGHILRGEEGR